MFSCQIVPQLQNWRILRHAPILLIVCCKSKLFFSYFAILPYSPIDTKGTFSGHSNYKRRIFIHVEQIPCYTSCARTAPMHPIDTAKRPKLSRERALEIINAMPYLVCTCKQKLLQIQMIPNRRNGLVRKVPEIYDIEFEVAEQNMTYKFPKQPFRVLCEITRQEFKRVAPWACTGPSWNYFYHIHSD
jgi:hypothetical protein